MKSVKERQIPYDVTLTWNLRHKHTYIKEKRRQTKIQTLSNREQTDGYRGEVDGRMSETDEGD